MDARQNNGNESTSCTSLALWMSTCTKITSSYQSYVNFPYFFWPSTVMLMVILLPSFIWCFPVAFIILMKRVNIVCFTKQKAITLIYSISLCQWFNQTPTDLFGECLIYSFFTFRSHQGRKTTVNKKITVQRTKRACAAEVFFCFICFDLFQNYGADFPNNLNSKQDHQPLFQRRFFYWYFHFVFFDINVKERWTPGKEIA